MQDPLRKTTGKLKDPEKKPLAIHHQTEQNQRNGAQDLVIEEKGQKTTD